MMFDFLVKQQLAGVILEGAMGKIDLKFSKCTLHFEIMGLLMGDNESR